ncbi:MAG TPA: SEC-C metal-binding domain-containing protein [Polyangiaceae bacterium]|nr:SEC-C metal-binding domain-containing protein [Polyangiaceae bacterium]
MSAFTFHVSPLSESQVYRTIEAAGSATLEQLHRAIVAAFNLDQEPAHAFFLNGHAWDAEFGVWGCADQSQRASSETRIESLELVERKRILYLYDFDAEICLDVRVTRIEKDASGPAQPALVGSAGELPPSYLEPSSDADEDEEEDEEQADAEAEAKRAELLAAAEPTLAALAERVRACIEFAEVRLQMQFDEMEEHFEDAAVSGAGEEGSPSGQHEAVEEGEGGEPGEADEHDDEEEGPSAEEEAELAEELLTRFGTDAQRITEQLEPLVDADVFDWLESVPQRLSDEGDAKRAFALAQRIVQLPWSESLRALLPRLAVRADRPDEALSLIEVLLRDEPQDPEILLQIALAFDELDQGTSAEQYYREALRYAGSDMDLRSEIIEHLVELLRQLGRDDQANKVMQAEVLHTQRFSPLFGPSSPPSEPFRNLLPKVGRNEPCPCGSGKKFKKCCGLN